MRRGEPPCERGLSSHRPCLNHPLLLARAYRRGRSQIFFADQRHRDSLDGSSADVGNAARAGETASTSSPGAEAATASRPGNAKAPESAPAMGEVLSQISSGVKRGGNLLEAALGAMYTNIEQQVGCGDLPRS